MILVGFLAFCSGGMNSALGYMGAGGLQDVQLSMISDAILYAMFFVAGFFGGSINVSSASWKTVHLRRFIKNLC